jgi:hypothetical protein
MNGLADYVDFFPCPYDQIVDAFDSIPAIPQPFDTVGDCDCGCMGGCGGLSGLMDGTGLLGTGLFVGGLDPSTWGAAEYAVLALGAFAIYSAMGSSRRGSSRRASVGRRKARQGGNTYSAGAGGKR